jgi:hypothetical protein
VVIGICQATPPDIFGGLKRDSRQDVAEKVVNVKILLDDLKI